MRNLSKDGQLLRLKRNEKLECECLYILTSESVSSTLYFESKRDVIFAHQLIKRHLHRLMDIVSYLFTPEGWVLIVRVRSEEEIKGYLKEKHGSRKFKVMDIGKEISEHLRYMISGLVKAINARTGRKGTLVSRTFGRYIVKGVENLEEVIENIESGDYCVGSQERRYRASLKYWDVQDEFRDKARVYLRSRSEKREGVGRGDEVKLLYLLELANITKDVLHVFVKRTIGVHFYSKRRKRSKFKTTKVT